VEELRVNSLTSGTLNFDAGDHVWIVAQGEVRVGPFVGYVDPDGRDSWLLSGYSIRPDVPHGALLCRLKGQSEWSYCGSDTEFQADSPGQLEFEINDNEQGNNDPDSFFQVAVVAAPYSVRADYVRNARNDDSSQAQSADGDAGAVGAGAGNMDQSSSTASCANSPANTGYCQAVCAVNLGDPNCAAVEQYNYERRMDEQAQREEEERRMRLEEEERRQREEEERRRQEEQQP
jgi:hypothetical protein